MSCLQAAPMATQGSSSLRRRGGCAGGTGAVAVPEPGTDPQLPTAHTGQGLPPLSEGLQNFTHFAFQINLFRSKGNQVLLAGGKHQEAKGL